ncbi:HAD family hydrolase [Actinoplanes couchii]|uniref:Haloacid dehalogenase n=1 Tax=Actinoplanes couchii TaxID=403638 RepID=A0ABQ3XCP1_9ACTN|nr:HAD family hydrolase [Actinoplanes couchii]MDR6321147.1 putative hydrolase of the HAD superfamily [Actinoplanes couchii]GID56256.1 haloacid dehalogenase [Actinoplanes couchii]
MRAVLFDLDDTLVDQVTAARTAVVGWAAAHGIDDPGVHERWAALSEPHYARWQRREITFQGQRRGRVREFLGRDLTDAAADELFAGYLERYEAGWVAFDDALPTLRRFRDAGLTVAVLTNGDEDQQRDKLERTGLAGAVDVLVASSALPAGKPDPRAFRHAVDLLGVVPEQAVMIGDSLEKDVRGALAAGLSAILLDRSGAHPDAGVPTIRTLDEAPTAMR